MAPYSLSACQVVRVFCAVLRALRTSPTMSLGIVFLTGYPTVKLLCNAMSYSLLFHGLLLTFTKCARPRSLFVLRATSLLKDLLSFEPVQTVQRWRHQTEICLAVFAKSFFHLFMRAIKFNFDSICLDDPPKLTNIHMLEVILPQTLIVLLGKSRSFMLVVHFCDKKILGKI